MLISILTVDPSSRVNACSADLPSPEEGATSPTLVFPTCQKYCRAGDVLGELILSSRARSPPNPEVLGPAA